MIEVQTSHLRAKREITSNRRDTFMKSYIYVEVSLGLGACNESSFGLDIVVMQ